MIYHIYKNSKEYDNIFTGIDDKENDFYLKFIKTGSVLYLGSGSGRLLKNFLKLNSDITGIELSDEMYKASIKLLPNAKIIKQDALSLSLGKTFDSIIGPYRFFCHFDGKNLQKLFKVISKHLKKGGVFVGDMFSPFLPHDKTIQCEVNSVEVYDDIVEKVFNSYDHKNQICTEWIERINTKTKEYSMLQLPWYYYYPEQIESMAKAFGMKVKNFYGDFNRSKLNESSKEMIYIISKL